MISRAQSPSLVTVRTDFTPHPAAHDAEPSSVLPAPDFVAGDPVAVVAKLYVKSAQQARESDDLTAKAAEQAEDAADAKRIEAMKEKAEMTLLAGFGSGLSQVAAGGCSVAGGVLGARATNESASRSVVAKWEGAGGVMAGAGKIGEAFAKSAADASEQAIARAESEAKVAKRAQEALRKEIDAAAQHESKVVQLLQEIKQAEAQCERAALLRMA